MFLKINNLFTRNIIIRQMILIFHQETQNFKFNLLLSTLRYVEDQVLQCISIKRDITINDMMNNLFDFRILNNSFQFKNQLGESIVEQS